jgi:hypothetical protein
MKMLRLAASIPVVLALVLVWAFHPTSSAARPIIHQDAESSRVKPLTSQTAIDLEGVATYCAGGGSGCTASVPGGHDFNHCGSDTAGCTEAWVDADGPHNSRRAGKPANVSVGCGKSYTIGNVMHFKYAALDTGTQSNITGVAAILGGTGDDSTNTPAALSITASGLGYNRSLTAYQTSATAVSVFHNSLGPVFINNYDDDLVAGGFTITFKGIIDETTSGESGSGGIQDTYLPKGTISCTIDNSNELFNTDFDAEVE